ncbi:MAG TPA: MBL fold metallo-hydrolase [Candidatus Binataceae bacterium]|nr:MBL fold metallo-hydrolase [Candidatus Binataceae bacterium]
MKRSAASSLAPTLRFLGAADTVTGSRFLVSSGKGRVLVDCGLFQGLKALRLRNWDPLPIEPSSLDAVVISHAHLDHSGYLPALYRDGFRERVFATEGTHALCRVVLPDSGHLQEEEANYANRKGYSKHTPALPLYTEDDAIAAIQLFKPIAFEKQIEVAPDITVTFRRAGHILGSSSVVVDIGASGSRRVLFSGDLGRPFHPILRPPERPSAADVIVVESTYGDRRHDDPASLKAFEDAVNRTAARGGVIVIPSFAVDRTEVVLYHLRNLVRAKSVPDLPIYVDSPMALAALRIYKDAIAQHSPEIRADLTSDTFDDASYHEARTVEDSIALNFLSGPAIIISASGMATGGRILHHLANRLPDERNAVVLVGYQSPGTRGHSMLTGQTSIKMLGRYIPVRAEIVNVPAFSVHADQQEILDWLASAESVPEIVYVVHGDPPGAEALRKCIEERLKWNAVVPRHLEQVRI